MHASSAPGARVDARRDSLKESAGEVAGLKTQLERERRLRAAMERRMLAMQYEEESRMPPRHSERRELELKMPMEYDASAIDIAGKRMTGLSSATKSDRKFWSSKRFEQSPMCSDQPSTKSGGLEEQLEELKAIVNAQQALLQENNDRIHSLRNNLIAMEDALTRTQVRLEMLEEGRVDGAEVKDEQYTCCEHHAGDSQPGTPLVTEEERSANKMLLKSLTRENSLSSGHSTLCAVVPSGGL